MSVTNTNETVADIVHEMREYGNHCAAFGGAYSPERWDRFCNSIETAHERDREAARRRAERSAIYNMLESFPMDWKCNPDVVTKWLAHWQRNADDLCEGGDYAE